MMLTYEISIPYLFIFVILFIDQNNIKKTIILLSPYFLCFIFVILINLYLRQNYSANINNNYQLYISITPILLTWARQIISTVPYSYAIFNNQGFIRTAFASLSWIDIISFLLYFIVLLKIVSYNEKIKQKKRLIIIGTLLVLLPGLLLTLSPKYQAEILAGNGYIPVFHQYFGAILILAIIYWEIAGKILKKNYGKYLNWFMLGLISFGLVINFKINIISVAKLNDEWFNERSIMDDALVNHFFDDIPQGSVLIYKKPSSAYYWQAEIYYFYAKKYFNVYDWDNYIPTFIKQNNKTNEMYFSLNFPNNVYIVDFNALNNSQGFVYIAKPKEIFGTENNYTINYSGIRFFLSNQQNLFLYVQNLFLGKPDPGQTYTIQIYVGKFEHLICKFENTDQNFNDGYLLSTTKGQNSRYSCYGYNDLPLEINNITALVGSETKGGQ